MNSYIPHPIDTSDIVLSDDILALSEELAHNTHEVWSKGRIADGWTYGETRDDVRQTHPCLTEYDQLSEEEKEFDRHTAMETLKLISKMGYEIKKK